MAEKVYQKIEIVGTSTQGFEKAVENAIQQARKTVKGMAWFEVTEQRGNLAGTEIEYQVTVKVGFRVMDE